MSYRDDVEALQQRVRTLLADQHANTRQLDEARRLLDDAQRKSRLPVLDNIHVAAPCKASWDQMIGDDRARFCGQCDKNVYNLSAMTRPEAEALLIEKEGRLCVRYYQRTDGTILTADCPDGQRRRRRKRRVLAAAFGAMSGVAAAGAFLHRSATVGSPAGHAQFVMGEAPAAVEEPVMGEPAIPPTATMGLVARAPSEPVMGRIRPAPTTGKPAFVPEKPHHKKR